MLGQLGGTRPSDVEGITHAATSRERAGAHFLSINRCDGDVDVACLNIPPADDTDLVDVISSEP